MSPVFSKKSKKRFFSMEKPYLPMFPRDNKFKNPVIIHISFSWKSSFYGETGANCKAKKHPIKTGMLLRTFFKDQKGCLKAYAFRQPYIIYAE
ncbi:hypothetical protein [Peribacillus frigoritolerans]|uniref:hypothetical protein n=1 Tax=Peribacillus frigoritolerans TaxID=450367 RepID=UPI00227F9006|nr:hypothetical protein [Peribacillus frigoritolerans]MCY9137868.1 hypothetical protein [Peribacillus frigoritolerans]